MTKLSPVIFILAISLSSFNVLNAQNVSKPGVPIVIDKKIITPVSALDAYRDPSYPKKINSEDKLADEINYKKQVRAWVAKQEPFPKYINTGDKEQDDKNYEKAKSEWFTRYPSYPTYYIAGDKETEQDGENYRKAVREWINYFPEMYQKILDAQNMPIAPDEEKTNNENDHDRLQQQSISAKTKVSSEKRSGEFKSIDAPLPDSLLIKYPTLPKYTDTGDKENDLKNYNEELKKWTDENPELFQKAAKKKLNDHRRLVRIERAKRAAQLNNQKNNK